MREKRCLLLQAASHYSSGSQQLGLAGFGEVKSVGAAVAELLAAKRVANRRAVYVKSLAHYLGRFAEGRAEKALVDVSSSEIEHWLVQFSSPYSRQTWLNRISTLFAFAVRRGWLERNPCARVERVMIDHKPPLVLSPGQARDLLVACPVVCRPWLVLAMFAGIRPDGELLKLKWEDVNLETATVVINFPKVRKQRRIVPLEPVAVALLRGHPLRSGAVAPSQSTLRRFKKRGRVVLGLQAWPADVLRHTAASYLLALHGDAGKVALRLGNSANVLLTHYHNPVRAEDCSAFWGLATD